MKIISFKSNNNYKQETGKQVSFKNMQVNQGAKNETFDFVTDLALIFGASVIVQRLSGFLNGNVLSKIMTIFGKKINREQMMDLSENMHKHFDLDKNGINAVKVESIDGEVNNACYSNLQKKIYYTENTVSAIPHELGHAIIDTKTKVLGFLQRKFYGNPFKIFNTLWIGAIGIKVLSNLFEKNDKQKILNKTDKFINKNYNLLGMLGFVPLLVSEFGASAIALNFARKQKNFGGKNLAKLGLSYGTAFCTYLMATFGALLITKLIYKITDHGKRYKNQNEVLSDYTKKQKKVISAQNKQIKQLKEKIENEKIDETATSIKDYNFNSSISNTFKQFILKTS